MPRENKFRVFVQEKDKKQFHYIDLDNDLSEYDIRVMQEFPRTEYTGLRDVSDLEIYEGDFITYIDGGSLMESGEYIVTFQGGAFRPLDNLCFEGALKEWGPKYTVAIIGNIYENPELCLQSLKY
jgi:hypothetical protein